MVEFGGCECFGEGGHGAFGGEMFPGFEFGFAEAVECARGVTELEGEGVFGEALAADGLAGGGDGFDDQEIGGEMGGGGGDGGAEVGGVAFGADGGEFWAFGCALAVDDVAGMAAFGAEEGGSAGGIAGEFFGSYGAEGLDVAGDAGDLAGGELPCAGHFRGDALGDGFAEGFFVGRFREFRVGEGWAAASGASLAVAYGALGIEDALAEGEIGDGVVGGLGRGESCGEQEDAPHRR